ncbi:MAG: cell division ATPase MinD [Hadesarchaea archaeon]|nr:cell division ATPase MinD [Hadesarchaea archaeon]
MRVITIGSGKGGVGRSTVTANLGAALAEKGEKTLVIDANLTSPNIALFFKLEKVPHTLNDALDGNSTIEEVLYDGPDGLKIAPAGLTLDKIRKSNPKRLPRLINEQVNGFDFVLIDAPDGLRQETISALSAGEELLEVAIPELTAISDAMKTKVASEFLNLKPLGLILNQIRAEDYELSIEEIKEIMNLPILGKIPYDKKVRMALKEGELLIKKYPNSPASKEIKNIAEKLIEKEED